MSELRRDPITNRWVVISAERAKRPQDFKTKPAEVHRDDFDFVIDDDENKTLRNCPFCTGNEDKTPPEICAYRAFGMGRNSTGWRVRTVPNKFPSLEIEGSASENVQGLNHSMNGLGAHEVIIETPLHITEFHKHSPQQMEEVIRMWRDRHLDLRRDHRLKYVLIFKNEGPEAGASLEHSHSQVMALPMVPKYVEEEIEAGIKPYLRVTGRCIFCDMVQQEISTNARVIQKSDHLLAFCPFASRFPFETWIIPIRHEPDFGLISEQEVAELGWMLREVIGGLVQAVGNAPYNLLLHSTPVNVNLGVSYHWHIEILPRLTKTAGFEYGTDYYINPTPPEIATQAFKTFH